LIRNKMYSTITSHETNFSKFNFNYYISGCKGFYDCMTRFCSKKPNTRDNHEAIVNHLGKWFITNMFNLKRYYTKKANKEALTQIDACIKEISAISFMRKFLPAVKMKDVALALKKRLGLL
jgi:hypothetical protein